jgi:hypothetical protein
MRASTLASQGLYIDPLSLAVVISVIMAAAVRAVGLLAFIFRLRSWAAEIAVWRLPSL